MRLVKSEIAYNSFNMALVVVVLFLFYSLPSTAQRISPTSGPPSNWVVPNRVVIIDILDHRAHPQSLTRTVQIERAITSIGENWEIRSIAATTGTQYNHGVHTSVTESVIIVVDRPKKSNP